MATEIRREELAKEGVERLGADAPAHSLVARVALVFAAWNALHLGVIGLLAAPVLPGGWWTLLAVFVLVVAAMLVLFATFRSRRYPGALQRLLVFRPFWYAQVSIFFLSLIGGLAFLVGWPFGRGVAFGRGALAVEAAILALVFLAGYVGSRALVVRRIDLEFPDLPAAFDGFTIAQLSDHHVGPHTPRGHVRRAVRAVEAARPDLVAHTGDQVDDFVPDADSFLRAFGGLTAPSGVFAVPGNHDVYAGWPAVRQRLEAGGVRVLVNEAHEARRGADSLWIVGTGDPAAAQRFVEAARDAAPDVPRALAAVPPAAFVVALAHNPALWPQLAARGVQLTLSGHTHHGQVSIPALNWCLASPFLRFAMGLYRAGGSVLHISPGTNYWGLPLRLGAWPEVTVLTLRRARPAASAAPR